MGREKGLTSLERQPKSFDLIIVGTGPAGYLSAILSARKGLSTAIIEKAELGGTCLNRGCVPTKTLIKEASLWDAFVKSGWGVGQDKAAASFRKAQEKKNTAVNQVVSGLRNLLRRDRITVFRGEASFINSRTLAVKKDGAVIDHLEAERILIASGAVPKEIRELKKDGRKVIGSNEVLRMTDLPSTIAIIGGGRRGVEFAAFFNAFGVKVTLIEKEGRILSKMDREISVRYKGLLTKQGIKVFTGTEAMAGEISEDDRPVGLTVIKKGKEERLEVETVLLVGDRRGNIDGLDIEKASLSLEEGFIPVDLQMKTPTPGIFAAGDVVGKGFLAHKAFLEARTAMDTILGKESQMDYRQIPICLYGLPEAASIGLKEEEAVHQGGEVTIGKFPFLACGQSIAMGNQEGMVKIISEKKYGEVLGVHILGPQATELIHLGAMAMKMGPFPIVSLSKRP